MADSNADVDMAAGGAAVDNAGADTAADEAKETLTPLYGGAMRAFIPAGFLDVRCDPTRGRLARTRRAITRAAVACS